MTYMLPRPAETRPCAAERIPAVALCECGLLLGHTAGTYLHLDVCCDCFDPRSQQYLPGLGKACDASAHRAACEGVQPVVCEHVRCYTVAAVDAWPCQYDRGACCGCCHGEY